eukprot:jgi/Bigna1/143259/aug1.77_g17967
MLPMKEGISSEDLAPASKNASVLGLLPLKRRQIIIQEMVEHLDTDVPALAESLQTDLQVRFMMEFLGASFNLPLFSNIDVVSSALNVYASWLLDERKPAPIHRNETYYYNEIFSQIALLFREEYVKPGKVICKQSGEGGGRRHFGYCDCENLEEYV